jgi:hypothetical protein
MPRVKKIGVNDSPFLKCLEQEDRALLVKDKAFRSWTGGGSITYRHISVKERTASNKTQALSSGGAWPHGFNAPSSALLQRTDDVDFIVLDLPSCHNFVMLGGLAILPRVICEIGSKEAAHIANFEKAKRSGGAGGFPTIVPGDFRYDPASLSASTQPERHLFRMPDSKSCALRTCYTSKANEQTVFSSLYNDPTMRRLGKKEKRETLLGCAFERCLIIAEMESRLKALTLVHCLNLHPPAKHTVTDNFMAAVRKANESSAEWLSQDPSLGFWEIILLEYGSGTGEMRNHQALCAHKDGNKSHFLETMTLFGRERLVPQFQGDYEGMVEKMQEGQLALLYDGVVLSFRCGKDILHMNLDKTVHVPDPSRNCHNWSRVHGP